MKHADFVHLHVHTQYSLLDGAIRLKDLFKEAKKQRMPALAMTDHGNMFGTIDFYQRAYKEGIKPIIGCELYVAAESRFTKKKQDAHHLIVLARDMTGYHNLMKLTSAGYLEGFYYRPRVDKALLASHSEGLIALSACLHGEVAHCLLKGDRESATVAAEEYRTIFGEENFYLELMENGLPEQEDVNRGLLSMGKELSIPVVATNDCHYLKKEDAEAHDILLCIQTGKTIDDTDRMRFRTDHLYFKSPEEMNQAFHYCPDAIENTVRIAERCNLTLDLNQTLLPHYRKIEKGVSAGDHLAMKAEQGLQRLMPSIVSDGGEGQREAYEQRLQSELDIIRSMGFPGYFLIVSDFVDHAKEKGIPVGPGRGSAAGSLVAYALGITAIDPIKYGLFFERFLNPDRMSMPDIDMDFCIEGRDDIIHYVTEEYGSDRVAQIITFGKMQAKAVVRDVGRALNIPYGEVDRIAKLIPNVLNITLEDAIKMEPRLREESKNNGQIKKLISLSLSLEGLNRHASTHAAGVVISDKPLVERVPLYKSPNNDDIVTQYSMNDLQAAGLVKFDFLGLKTLTVIKNTLSFIQEGRGERVAIETLSLDDPLTYELLVRGQTDGVFQLESAGMKELLVSMKPDCIEDLIALISLYRPGPMNMVSDFIARKQGKKKIAYEVPQLEAILKETYGIILYQEQVMQIVSIIGNYTMAEGDNLRRVMSKKKPADMERERPKFLAGAKKNNLPESKVKEIWKQMETFAGYGFNKSHSTAYAMISFQTAYLKAHYPVEFMAALLTSEKNNRDNIIKYIANCKDMEIRVLPPDINKSFRDFSVADNNIRFGLAAVKNVGIGAVDSIIEAREGEGKFLSFYDFCSKIDLRKVNKKVLESLIKCGAFDSIESGRRHVMEGFEGVVEFAQKKNAERLSGQLNLFDQADSVDDMEPQLPDMPEWEHDELLSYEKETLGFYLTGHPLSRYEDALKLIVNATAETIGDKKDGTLVSIAGIVSNVREVTTRKKEMMAYVTVEDMKGGMTVIVFPELYRSVMDLIKGDDPIFVTGKIDAGEEGSKVIASEISTAEEAMQTPVTSIHFMLDGQKSKKRTVTSLKAMLERYRGEGRGYIHVLSGNGAETILYLGDSFGLEVSEEVKKEADAILGDGATTFK